MPPNCPTEPIAVFDRLKPKPAYLKTSDSNPRLTHWQAREKFIDRINEGAGVALGAVMDHCIPEGWRLTGLMVVGGAIKVELRDKNGGILTNLLLTDQTLPDIRIDAVPAILQAITVALDTPEETRHSVPNLLRSTKVKLTGRR